MIPPRPQPLSARKHMHLISAQRSIYHRVNSLGKRLPESECALRFLPTLARITTRRAQHVRITISQLGGSVLPRPPRGTLKLHCEFGTFLVLCWRGAGVPIYVGGDHARGVGYFGSDG